MQKIKDNPEKIIKLWKKDMLEYKKRIIPIFTYKNNVLVKSVNYSNYRNVNSILPIIRLFNKRNIDEMIFLNLEDKIDFGLLENFVNEVDYPITYGGNISDIETMRKIYKIGFDKVALNSILYKNISFAKEACKIFGKQSIVASIDIRKIDNQYRCFYHNGKIDSGLTVVQHLENIINADCISEIIITSIDNDGTFSGFDEKLYETLQNFKIRILVNGGGNYDGTNIVNVLKIPNVYGLCFSSLFFFKQYTPNDIKKMLKNNNIPFVNSLLPVSNQN